MNKNLKKLISYYVPYRGLLTANLISTVLLAALALLFPILVRHITINLLDYGNINDILQIGGIMLALIIIQTFLAIFYAYKGHDMGAKIERDMRAELFAKYQEMPLSFYENQKIGQLMSRMTNDLNGLSEMMHHTPENILMYGLQFTGALTILFILDWRLTLIVCLPLIFTVLYTFPYYKKMQKVKRESRVILGDVNSHIQENLTGIATVKSFARESYEKEKFQKENFRFYDSMRKIYKYEAYNFEPVEFFFRSLVTVVIVVAGGIMISLEGFNFELADLLVFVLYAGYLTGPMPNLAFMVEQAQEGLIGFERFREIMDEKPEITDAPNALTPSKIKGRVSFKNVSFKYENAQGYALKNISFEAAPKEIIAITGGSGIGKTTLCALIPRFYDATEGAVLIDGIDVREYAQNALRGFIGIVAQDVFLFNGTILENILYGSPNASEAQVIEAAKRAYAHDFIMQTPEGYNTKIGARGQKLSGGQRQRLSIARVFLKNPPIVIFDEATSALDYESERAVMESLRALSEDRTAFIIAHRQSTIANATRIIELGKDIS